MSALAFESYSEARDHFRQVLDAAGRGEPVIVRRQGRDAAVVSADRLRELLARLCPPRAQVVSEGGGWTVLLPGLPIAVDGATLDEALDETVLALREYALDWQDRLKNVSNHRENWGLVQLVGLSDDGQLREWLAGSPA